MFSSEYEFCKTCSYVNNTKYHQEMYHQVGDLSFLLNCDTNERTFSLPFLCTNLAKVRIKRLLGSASFCTVHCHAVFDVVYSLLVNWFHDGSSFRFVSDTTSAERRKRRRRKMFVKLKKIVVILRWSSCLFFSFLEREASEEKKRIKLSRKQFHNLKNFVTRKLKT